MQHVTCIILQVSDEDQGSNGEVDFSIEFMSPPTFALVGSGALSAEMHLIRALDRETVNFYSFRIFATDRGSPALFSEAAIVITITVSRVLHLVILSCVSYVGKLNLISSQDVNDNAPAFQQDTYTAVFLENTANGTQLATVVAEDSDIGTNADIVYSSGNPDQVSVHPESGVVTLVFVPDFEVSSEFTFEASFIILASACTVNTHTLSSIPLQIIATDSGMMPQLFGTTNVSIAFLLEKSTH